MSTGHAFVASLEHTDYCAHCGNARAAAIHDTFSSSAAHPGLAKLRPSARLAALLGCSLDELATDLANLVTSPVRAAISKSELAMRAAYDSAFTIGQCKATHGDDNRCERAQGHRGVHVHINTAWDHGATLKHVRLEWRRCAAACADPTKVRGCPTARCVLAVDHEGETHELDNGEVFR